MAERTEYQTIIESIDRLDKRIEKSLDKINQDLRILSDRFDTMSRESTDIRVAIGKITAEHETMWRRIDEIREIVKNNVEHIGVLSNSDIQKKAQHFDSIFKWCVGILAGAAATGITLWLTGIIR
jgi:ABC-type Zn uptake system ZnuABC Zn-binding protein ZnuA